MRAARWVWVAGIGWILSLATPAGAVDVRVTIENVAPSGSVAFSPFGLVAHDGTLDGFDAGTAASPAIESVAETGDSTLALAAATMAQSTAVTGTAFAGAGGVGPGIYPPGVSGSVVLSLDPTDNRYLSFRAMVVPSNDAFFGNDSPTAVELFDAMGNFVASNFVLSGNQIWDAGTEVNQLKGAAYVVGQDIALGDTEGGTVQLVDPATEFAPYMGQDTPDGGMFTVVPSSTTPIASFSFQVVPEPASGLLASLSAVVALFALRRRRR